MQEFQQDRAAITQCVRSLFYSSSPPSIPDKSESNSDNYDDIEKIAGRTWDELSPDIFYDSPHIFFSLPSNALSYYLGALMYVSLKHGDFKNDALLMILGAPSQAGTSGRPTFIKERIRKILTDQQRLCFSTYLDHILDFVDNSWRARISSTILELS